MLALPAVLVSKKCRVPLLVMLALDAGAAAVDHNAGAGQIHSIQSANSETVGRRAGVERPAADHGEGRRKCQAGDAGRIEGGGAGRHRGRVPVIIVVENVVGRNGKPGRVLRARHTGQQRRHRDQCCRRQQRGNTTIPPLAHQQCCAGSLNRGK